MFTTHQSNFFHFNNQRPSTKLPIQCMPLTLSLGMKQAESKAEHFPPSSAEVKNLYRYTVTPPYVVMTSHFKHRDFYDRSVKGEQYWVQVKVK